MSKHTVTMKTLMDENAQLKMKLHNAEREKVEAQAALAAYKGRSFWQRLVNLLLPTVIVTGVPTCR